MMQHDRCRADARFLRPTAMAAFALAATLTVIGPARAQEAAAWRVECTGDGKALDCRAVQDLYQRDNRQLLALILVRKGSDPKGAQMTIRLPLGLNLTEPILIKVDNGQPEHAPIQTCTNVGCFVTVSANEKLVASMRSGHEIKVTVFDSAKKPLEISLPLLGFGLAFDKARS